MKDVIAAAMMAALLSGGPSDGNPVARMMGMVRAPIAAYSGGTVGSSAFGWSGPGQTHPVRFGW